MLRHIGLQYRSKKDAETFFNKILGLPMQRTFTMSCELGKSIFGIEEEVGVEVFGKGEVVFEVFIGDATKKFSYEHICLEIPDKEKFISRCKNYGIEPKIVRKSVTDPYGGDKDLLFIRDFSGYLYEIKEKQNQ
ncbi:MAG: VOC family protein [candidate division WOR-3 bacterium]|nr:VOC family protein [candidate division WOR-3 bacterium]